MQAKNIFSTITIKPDCYPSNTPVILSNADVKFELNALPTPTILFFKTEQHITHWSEWSSNLQIRKDAYIVQKHIPSQPGLKK